MKFFKEKEVLQRQSRKRAGNPNRQQEKVLLARLGKMRRIPRTVKEASI